MAMSLIERLCLLSTALILYGDCLQMEQQLCDSACTVSSHSSYERGMRYTYRYTTTISTSVQGSNAGRNGLALDCVVDIDVISNCHLLMQIRNPQIKRLSPQKEHSVQRLKSLRESLERSRLKFSLRGGKVTALCPQEGEQVWTLNIQRAVLSMLQTSRTNAKQETVLETDVYGTCASWYEARGPVLVKTRDLQQCQQEQLADFWPHSSRLTEDTTVDSKLQCTQRHGTTIMEEVNCTETVSVATPSGTTSGAVKTQTTSTLVLLRAQEGTPSGLDTLGPGVRTDLRFEKEGAEGPARGRTSSTQEASDTVRRLCSLTADQRQVSELFLHLAFQLRALSLPLLRELWQEASFKCRNDWMPLLDALPACGSEECVLLLTELIRDGEIEQDRAGSYLSTLAIIPQPSPAVIRSVHALLEVTEVRSKALLAGSSLVHQLCLRSPSPCGGIPEVQSFMRALENLLGSDCGSEEPSRLTELLYALKAVGNAGLAASALVPQLNRCAASRSAPLELRLAAVQAFRRIPCSAGRGSVVQLYSSPREDGEVRIAAYLQLMRCPDPEALQAVKRTLSNETSSQVGSFVWSHLTHILRTEDPLKQALMEALPDDIISRDFEAEQWKYSSYSDYTVDSGLGTTNMEGSLVFSPKSFIPRSAMANLTVYVHGRAFNLLEVELRAENIEPLFKRVFGHRFGSSDEEPADRDGEEVRAERRRRKAGDEGDEGGVKETGEGDGDDGESQGGREGCSSDIYGYLRRAREMHPSGGKQEDGPRCWVSVKVFGNELTALTCADLYAQIKQLSLSMAGLTLQLLKGQEIQLNHRAVLVTEELVLPSLSGLPIRLAVNMTSLLSLRLKGRASYTSPAHFAVAGYVKPSAYVGLSARMGVEGALGSAAVEWSAELRTSSSLDGSVQLQEGQDLRVTLNTPEDFMDIISLSSRLFHVSGDHREEMKGPKTRVDKTTCTPKTWSKMVGWQLCSNTSYPLSPMGITLPPPGPAHLSLRLLKLDRGLHQYLLEAVYSLLPQRDSWLPREASLHLLLATPHSSIPRDVSLDLALGPQRLLLKLRHPQKTVSIQGQLDHVRNIQTGKLELLIDNIHHYYVMGLIDTQTLQSEQRLRYHLEAKMAADRHPMILSANVSRGLGRKTSLSAVLKNVFKETASVSVALERRLDEERWQYSAEAELLLPGVVGSRVLGLMQQKGPLWSSALRLKYGLGEEARHLRQECYTSQSLRSEREPNQTYSVRAEHEFYCSNTAPLNHKVQLRHEESPSHTKSSLDVSYGKHWDEINNKHRLLLSQTFRNQSRQNLTSYALEFSFQVPEKHMNYRTQLLHSHLRQRGAESSTHVKVNYNDQMPLVAGLHWKDASKASLRKWEGTFTMDTPWLYVYTAHKLSQPQRHALQLTSELTARKWLTVRSLVLDGLYRSRTKDGEARLHLYTPTVTYLKAGGGWGVAGTQGLKASCSLSSLWSPSLRGDLSLETTEHSQTLQLASSYGKHNLSLTAALNTPDQDLKKRLVTVKVVFSEPKSQSMELEFEGGVEELRKDKMVYQKRAILLLRQPFQSFLRTVLLQETFTVDLHQGLYILESKAGLPGNREAVHTLTLGYRPPRHSVCSSLIHSFTSDTVPPDSEVCVALLSNQTQREVLGRVRVGRKDRLTFLGLVQVNPADSPQRGVKVRADLTQHLQLQLPSSAILEGDVSWKDDKSVFDYLASGRVGLDRQSCQFSVHLNGTAENVGLYSFLSHPYKSKIPKSLEAQATAAMSQLDGGAGGALLVRADGKDRASLEARLTRSLRGGTTTLGAHVNLTQSLLPAATADLRLDMAANVSSHSLSVQGTYRQDRDALLAQVRGSLERTPSLQVAVSGDLRHALPSLAFLPPALGLDGALAHSSALTEGQLRVRAGEGVYSVELSHQEDPGDSREAEEEGMLGKEPDRARDWLCAWAGEESLCLNVSRRLRYHGRGGVDAQLSHSSTWLHATGIPGNSSVQASWTQEESRLAASAELRSGAQAMKAEFEGGRRGQAVPRWELYSRLEHQIETLASRGLPSSAQAKAHYQMDTEDLNAGLAVEMEEQRTIDLLLTGGKSNSTAHLALSLQHQLGPLTGAIPSSLQMNCTGGAATDRLSARCSGSAATGRTAEVRAFRSRRPHGRLCYGLALTVAGGVAANAKGCLGPAGRAELRANLTRESGRPGTPPPNSSLRLLVRPGPKRWALGLGVSVGPWRAELSGAARTEAWPGLYGWRCTAEYGGPGVGSHRAEVRGRVRARRWCHLWADVGATWGSVSSSLGVSVRCGGPVRVAWLQVRDNGGGGEPSRTSLTVLGRAGRDGALTGSLDLERDRDSLRCLLSLLLGDRKAELGWSLRHRWASLSASVPEKVELRGSAGLGDEAASALLGPVQAQVELESDDCAVSAAGMFRRGGEGGGGGGDGRSWSLSVRQRCVSLKNLLPPYFLLNGSLVRSDGGGVRLDASLRAADEERAALSLTASRRPRLSLRCTAGHSLAGLRALGVPRRGALVLALSEGELPEVELGLELGECDTRANAGKMAASATETETERSTWSVNVTHYCPLLQDTVFPVSLVLQGLVSVLPCQLALTSALRVDDRDLTLELGRSCRPPRLSATLAHSFPALRSRGLPLTTSVEASAPGGPGEGGSLLVEAGACRIRARGEAGPEGRTLWFWAAESECPFLQALGLPSHARLNGSVEQDDRHVWTAAVDAGVEGEGGSLRLTAAGAGPGMMRLEGELSHNMAALWVVPAYCRLLVTGGAGPRSYDAEAQLHLGECAAKATGTVVTDPLLQGALLYHNNCSALQEWGSPDKMESSGSVVVNDMLLETQVSMVMDERELQALLALRTSEGRQEVSAHLNHSVPLLLRAGFPANAAMTVLSKNHGNGSYHHFLHCSVGRQQFTGEMTAERSARIVRVKSHLNHTVASLRNLGLPENNLIQIELVVGETRNLTLRSRLGAQQAGVAVWMRVLPRTTELGGNLQHSWLWLRDRGLPLTIEALCSVQGPPSLMWSRAQLSVDGRELAASSLNVSLADGHLATLLSLDPPASLVAAGYRLDASLTAQFTGPLKSLTAEVRGEGRRVRLSGDVRGWGGPHGGSREARATLRHELQGQTSPALQVEAWARLTGSQLRCSVAVNPELSSSLALIIQGHRLPESKELTVKVVQNIPQLLPYLPAQVNARSQLNHSSSSVGGSLELSSGRRRLWVLGQLAITEGGFRQAVELNHTYPQLKPLPRTVAVRTQYKGEGRSHRLQLGTAWGGREVQVAGLYSAPPRPELGDHTLKVQMASVPRGSSLDVTLARSPHARLDSVLLGWNRHGRQEQVRVVSSWRGAGEKSETRVELEQPFTSAMSFLRLHALSHSSERDQKSSHETHLSWDSGVPVNVSLTLSSQWQDVSSRGQACALFSSGLAIVPSTVDVEGCVSVTHEGNSYSQNAKLKWGDRSVRQGMKYQRGPRGTHEFQLEAGAENVSPAPCPSHSVLAQVHTNLRDRLQHHLVLGLCPPHPSLAWSGDHRVNVGAELLYTQTRLSVMGEPAHCSLTLGLTNSSTAHGTNITLFAESGMGNWSVEVGGSALSSPQGPGLLIQARLDRSEQVWLKGVLEGWCLRTTAGYNTELGPDEDLAAVVCVEGRRRLTLEVLRREGGGAEPEALATLTMGTANRSLALRARGCAASLLEVEARVYDLGCQMRNKLLDRVQSLQHLLTELRRQSRSTDLLQALTAVPMRLTQKADALLGRREGGLWAAWRSSALRLSLTDSLPRLLALLGHASQLGQQELKRPLGTLAGAYHDVTGQRLEAAWRGAAAAWTSALAELLPPLLESPQLRPLSRAGLTTLGTLLDLVGQQTVHWAEGRLAASLSGLRRRLASVYRLSPSECTVSLAVALPLPHGPWSWARVAEAGVLEVVLEGWLLRPLQALSSLKPGAELYRLKRKIMDSPFRHQALLVADQYVVTFDGRLYELPAACPPLLLARDVARDSFAVLLSSERGQRRSLLVGVNNRTVVVHQDAQIKVNCRETRTSYSDGLVIKRDSNLVEVSNQDGMSVSCDPSLDLCSLTLDGWLHGVSTGLLGTNDNEAGNDFPLLDGSQAENMEDFVHSWQVTPECGGELERSEACSETDTDTVGCEFLFSAHDSPLGFCFRVVDPAQFLRVCVRSRCGSVSGPSTASCRLAAAYVHLCQRNYVPLELPVQCIKL